MVEGTFAGACRSRGRREAGRDLDDDGGLQGGLDDDDGGRQDGRDDHGDVGDIEDADRVLRQTEREMVNENEAFCNKAFEETCNNAMLNFMKLMMVTKVSVAMHGSTYIHLHYMAYIHLHTLVIGLDIS